MPNTEVVASSTSWLPGAESGVVWNESKQKWEAHDVFGFRLEHVGIFSSQQAARDALNLILPSGNSNDNHTLADDHPNNKAAGRIVESTGTNGQWLATLRIPNDPGKLLGIFDNIQEAHTACEIARQQRINAIVTGDSESGRILEPKCGGGASVEGDEIGTNLESRTKVDSGTNLESAKILKSKSGGGVSVDSGETRTQSRTNLGSGGKLELARMLESTGTSVECQGGTESDRKLESGSKMESGTKLECATNLESGSNLESGIKLKSRTILEPGTNLESRAMSLPVPTGGRLMCPRSDALQYQGMDVGAVDRGAGNAFVGCEIRVFWPEDQTWYRALITKFHTSSSMYTILYDEDNVVEDIDLRHHRVQVKVDKAGTRSGPWFTTNKDDTLAMIAETFNLKLEELAEANEALTPTIAAFRLKKRVIKFHADTRIFIPMSISAPTPSSTGSKENQDKKRKKKKSKEKIEGKKSKKNKKKKVEEKITKKSKTKNTKIEPSTSKKDGVSGNDKKKRKRTVGVKKEGDEAVKVKRKRGPPTARPSS